MIADSNLLDNELSASPLGKKLDYHAHYNPNFLFAIPRKIKRDELLIPEILPFYGFDTWNAYEVSWLNSKGKPVVAIIQFNIPCTSVNLIESKSFKHYLNSFNNSQFDSEETVKSFLLRDLSSRLGSTFEMELFPLKEFNNKNLCNFTGVHLDELEVDIEHYEPAPSFLKVTPSQIVNEVLYSDLLKSNCLVTGQPDWASVRIEYNGPQIDHNGLLQYIISFRNHNEFHEQCVERIFMDIMSHCQPLMLTVEARYTRRGGLDINPIRSTHPIKPAMNIRMPRQ